MKKYTDSNMKPTGITKNQLRFLKKLNAILSQKQKEIYERSKELFVFYEKQLGTSQSRRHEKKRDFKIEIVIEWRTSLALESPKYYYTIWLDWCDFNEHEYYKREKTIFSDKDWKEEALPDFGEKWCYLMYALYSKVRNKESIYKIIRVSFETYITEYEMVPVIKHVRIV